MTAGCVAERELKCREALQAWAKASDVSLNRLDLGQQWVIFAALNLIAFLGTIPVMKRLTGYLLAHSGMGLGTKVIAAVIGLSARSLRSAQVLKPEEMLHSVRHPVGGHRKPKLKAEHAGVVAKYLVEYSQAEVSQILGFIKTKIGVTMDRHTLCRYFKRYGLGCLRGEKIVDPSPLLPRRSTEELFS
jgi:transposase